MKLFFFSKIFTSSFNFSPVWSFQVFSALYQPLFLQFPNDLPSRFRLVTHVSHDVLNDIYNKMSKKPTHMKSQNKLLFPSLMWNH